MEEKSKGTLLLISFTVAIVTIGVLYVFFRYLGDKESMDSSNNNVETVETEGGDTVVFVTTAGEIEIKLADNAPITSGNFVKLAEDDFYDGTRFHRVIENFMIQGGDPKSKNVSLKNEWGTGGPGYTIQDEFSADLSNVRGTISMANAGPNTGGSQFFINVVDNKFLDNKHAVFGEVVRGMEIVDSISHVPTDSSDRPVQDIVITDIKVLD